MLAPTDLVANQAYADFKPEKGLHLLVTGGDNMENHDDDNEKVPMLQQLLDNPFLLLFIGVMVPMIVYSLWGVIDILTIPVAK